MSDRSNDEVLGLIDQAAHEAPQMYVAPDAVLDGGRRRARRRQLAGGGMAIGALALAGSIWLAADSGLLGASPPPPAAPVVNEEPSVDDGAVDADDDARVPVEADTDPDEAGDQDEAESPVEADPDPVLDVELFTGVRIVDGEQTYTLDARLVQHEVGPVTLELTDTGELVETIEAQTPIPGLDVFVAQTMTVGVWEEPEGVTAVPLVGPEDPGIVRGGSEGGAVEEDGRLLGFRYWAGEMVEPPLEVLEVYFVSDSSATSLSGAPVEAVVMQAADQEAMVFVDPDRDVWGHIGTYGSGTLPELAPESATHVAGGDAELGITTYLLPIGATDVEVSNAGGGSIETDLTTLADRPVVLVVAEGPSSGDLVDPQVTFTMDGQAYEYWEYPHRTE